MRKYSHAVVILTTRCNLSCARCCYRVPEGGLGEPRDFDYDILAAGATYLSGLRSICLSGGEPGLHPDFSRIAETFRELYRPERFHLATNGEAVVRYPDSMVHFDEVRVTAFSHDVSWEAIELLRKYSPTRLRIQPADHLPLLARERPARSCARRSIAAWFDGRLYPCCVAPGLEGESLVPRGPDALASLARLPLPCGRCPFSVAIPCSGGKGSEMKGVDPKKGDR